MTQQKNKQKSLLKRLKVGSTNDGLNNIFRTAYYQATKSNDPKTKVGSCVIDDFGDIIGMGHNRILADINIHPERFVSPEKYLYVEHAEASSVAKCGARPHTLVATWAACSVCAIDIWRAGIKTVISDYRIFEHNESIMGDGKWNDSIHAALNIFEENNIEFYVVIPDLSSYNLDPIMVSGELFYP